MVHLDEGFDFLGFRIQRRRKRGTNQHHVYTYPSKTALAAIKAKVRRLTHRTSPIPPRALLPTRQCGVARMGQLLPVRSVQAHVQLPRLVRMAAGHPLAAPTTQRPVVESPTTSVHAGMGHHHRRRGSAHAVDDQGVPLPLPRNSYSNTLDGDSNRKLNGMNSWRRSTRPPLSFP